MAVNMQYCRVQNVLEAVEELVDQLQGSTGLSAREHQAALNLMSPVRELQHLLQETYNRDEDEDDE